MSFIVKSLPPPSNSLVRNEMQDTRVFGLLEPLPGVYHSNDVTSGSLPVT